MLRAILTTTVAVSLSAPLVAQQKLTYPPTKRGDVVDTYSGKKIADPYRWLEDADSAETKAWVQAQATFTEKHLAELSMRERFKDRITRLWDYPKTGVPRAEGGALFYSKNSGLQKQAPVFMRRGTGAEREILDPNTLSPDGSVSLAQWAPSPDAKLLAYATSAGGADWQDVHVRDLATGKDLNDKVEWVRFSGLSWTNDAKGFFYSRYPAVADRMQAELKDQALYYHRIGTPQSADVKIYSRPDLPSWFVFGASSDDGRWLFIVMAKGAENKNRLYVADLGDPKRPNLTAPVRALFETDDAEYSPLGVVGNTIYLRTDRDAPNRKIVAADIRNPDPARWRTAVAESKHAIEGAAMTSDRIVLQMLEDVKSRLSLWTFDGKPAGDVALPSVGTIGGLSAKRDAPDLYYAFTSILYPPAVFHWDAKQAMSARFDKSVVTFDPSLYETTQVFYASKDGTRVPMFLTMKKGAVRNGTSPTMLYAYGGFSVSMLPAFSPSVIAWIEQGGIYAQPSIRGGAEYGEAWHEGGMLGKKQNVFDDFIAAAEYLVAEKWTSPAHLAIRGGSNGGLLVGAVMEQRPDMFAVAIPQVGVMDMLRYDQFTGGRAWVTEYGSAQDPAAFEWLIKYSPLHNVKPGSCYPATLVTTADHDDRVVPGHSMKFAAALQSAQGCTNPTLIRIEVQGSHGYRPTDKAIAEAADIWAFAHRYTSSVAAAVVP
ncbi:MAG: prolyl oligopeptidase family serine peptidase [Gemmatimonadetes bacterium]|nr:prolyl oligopeptidase family serine peptidase [Gemmatimonadota bacterium]